MANEAKHSRLSSTGIQLFLQNTSVSGTLPLDQVDTHSRQVMVQDEVQCCRYQYTWLEKKILIAQISIRLTYNINN